MAKKSLAAANRTQVTFPRSYLRLSLIDSIRKLLSLALRSL